MVASTKSTWHRVPHLPCIPGHSAPRIFSYPTCQLCQAGTWTHCQWIFRRVSMSWASTGSSEGTVSLIQCLTHSVGFRITQQTRSGCVCGTFQRGLTWVWAVAAYRWRSQSQRNAWISCPHCRHTVSNCLKLLLPPLLKCMGSFPFCSNIAPPPISPVTGHFLSLCLSFQV